jgi:hypothetical protein
MLTSTPNSGKPSSSAQPKNTEQSASSATKGGQAYEKVIDQSRFKVSTSSGGGNTIVGGKNSA